MGNDLAEKPIGDFHNLYLEGRISSVEVLQSYLKRIRLYDNKLNSIVVLNPKALRRAEELDEKFRKEGKLLPLHGIPIVVKDNYDTHDLQTSAGSRAMRGSIPPDDAHQVSRLREAGAIVLGKSNMAEWAFSPYQTVSSILGTTRNPYDLERVPAGSSGGTAAAVAANLAAVGLGTDTGNSIRGPSSHCSLVGIRSTMGLTSRDGIIPLYLRNDVGGPMCRTVEDAVRVLEVIAGYDPADPVTIHCRGKIPDSYTKSMKEEGLGDKRIGVFRYFTDEPTADKEVVKLFENAIDVLDSNGSEIIDPFQIPEFEKLTEDIWCDTFKVDIQSYLDSLKYPPFSNLREIIDSGLYSDYIEDRLRRMAETPKPSCGDVYSEPKNIKLRETIQRILKKDQLDAFIYPTWSNPPRLIGDLESPHGDNSQKIPPHTGFPGFSIPMGFTDDYLPAGLQVVGDLFSEPTLIKISYAYEQTTFHRKPPRLFGETK
ncbi:amidase [Candidatus Bathyarchaeota archaeon]|nr:amidase [Candidatus Bathyarchaeota archaeon]